MTEQELKEAIEKVVEAAGMQASTHVHIEFCTCKKPYPVYDARMWCGGIMERSCRECNKPMRTNSEFRITIHEQQAL